MLILLLLLYAAEWTSNSYIIQHLNETDPDELLVNNVGLYN